MKPPTDGQVISACLAIIGLLFAAYSWKYGSEKIK